MSFLLLLILALAYLQTRWPAPPDWLTPFGAVLATWAGVFLLVGAAGWMVQRFRHQLRQDPRQCGRLLRRYLACRRVHLAALIAFYFLASYLAGWGWTVKHCLTYGKWSIPGAELLILLPFLAGLFLSWARFYDAELAVRDLANRWEKRGQPPFPLPPPEPGQPAEAWEKMAAPFFPARWAYVGLQARQSLILASPPFVLLLAQQVLFGLFPALPDDPLAMPLLSGGMLGLLFCGWPWLLRLLLNLKPLPASPLRDRLDQASRRLSFRCADILVWDTHDSLATALLAGPLPALRYVVLSDRLLTQMEPEEVEAVFAHEVGHVKHRHMLLYFVFLIGSLLAFSALAQATVGQLPAESVKAILTAHLPWPEFWLANRDLLLALLLSPLLLVYLFLIFGLLSRRCERQADMYACRAVSASALIAALEKVAVLNGLSRDRPGPLASWRHGTIAQRVACLREIEANPRRATYYQYGIRLVQWGLLLVLGCLVLAVGPDRLWDMLRQL